MVKTVVTMIVRDEDDVIAETIQEISKYSKDIIVLDGGSEDNTVDIIRQFPYVDLHQVNSGNNWDQPGEREMLLNWARDKKADWVITLDADEIYHTDPVRTIELADKEGATLINVSIPQFLFTEKEILDGTLQSEDESLSVQLRRKYYMWGWSEQMIFKMHDGLTYLGDTSGKVTRPPYFVNGAVKILSKVTPIMKHYQYRSLRQYAKRMKTRRRNCGKNAKRWFRWTYENPFYNEESINYFDGIFRDKDGVEVRDYSWE